MEELVKNTNMASRLRNIWMLSCWAPVGIIALMIVSKTFIGAMLTIIGATLVIGLSFVYLLFGTVMFTFIRKFRDRYFLLATLIGSIPALLISYELIAIMFFGKKFHI